MFKVIIKNIEEGIYLKEVFNTDEEDKKEKDYFLISIEVDKNKVVYFSNIYCSNLILIVLNDKEVLNDHDIVLILINISLNLLEI